MKEYLNILVIENDEVSIGVIKLFLRDKFNVESAPDGLSGLQKAKSVKYDLALLDINLGRGIDGNEVLVELKKIQAYEKVPVIAVTANAMVGDKEKFIEAGFSAYLSKPFSKRELLDIIEKSLNR